MKTIVSALLLAAATPVFAQGSGAPGYTQRDIRQEQRIEQGLRSGELTTREAARLQQEQGRIDQMQARALRDGKVTTAEKARISAAQNRASRDIARQKHDAQQGDAHSASSRRMQADVRRNITQERRIQQGMASGRLTNREASRLEAGQAHVDRIEARAGRDGHVGRAEEARVQHAETVQSRRIARQKHNRQTRD